jgi:hypothetical protein
VTPPAPVAPTAAAPTLAAPSGANAQTPPRTQAAGSVDAAFAPGAQFQTGAPQTVNRVRTTGSGRTLLSLDSIALTPAQRRAATSLHGQSMRGNLLQAWRNAANAREQADLAEINRLWNQGTPQSQQDARVLARDAFDRHRIRFWSAVRADPQTRGAFQAAGMRFTGGRGAAPTYTLPDGTVARMTLEHTTRLADNPTRALNGANLQFVLDDENSVFLEFIRANDPFQR